MFSLRQPVRRMAAYVPPALAAPAALTRIEQVADWFPAAITDCFCFEIGLTGETPSADFSFLCRRSSAGADILAEVGPITLRQELLADPTWSNVRQFCQAWARLDAGLRERITHLIVEVDVRGDDGLPTPCIFLGVTGHPPDDIDWLRHAGDLLGFPISAEAAKNLRQLRSVTAAGDFHIGVMLSRQSNSVRLVVDGVNDAVFRTLADLGAGDLTELRAIAAGLEPLTDVINIAVDVGASIEPRVGLECKISENVRMDRARWERLLDYLVALDCCTSSRRHALLDWPGGTVERLRHLALPAAMVRKISHFKIVRQPGEGLHGKAYLFSVRSD